MKKLETVTDRANEDKVAEVVGRHLQVKLRPCPRFFPADYVSTGEEIYVEIRCRNHTKGKFPDMIMSAKKWCELLKLRFDELSPRIYFAVAWTDRVGILGVDFGETKIIPFRRTKSMCRGYAEDFDVVVSLPVETFRDIGYGLALEHSENWMGGLHG